MRHKAPRDAAAMKSLRPRQTCQHLDEPRKTTDEAPDRSKPVRIGARKRHRGTQYVHSGGRNKGQLKIRVVSRACVVIGGRPSAALGAHHGVRGRQKSRGDDVTVFGHGGRRGRRRYVTNPNHALPTAQSGRPPLLRRGPPSFTTRRSIAATCLCVGRGRTVQDTCRTREICVSQAKRGDGIGAEVHTQR